MTVSFMFQCQSPYEFNYIEFNNIDTNYINFYRIVKGQFFKCLAYLIEWRGEPLWNGILFTNPVFLFRKAAREFHF